MQRNQIMNMMYLAKSGEVSKRNINIIKIAGNSFQAYCFTKQAKRTFTINNVLAIVPVLHKEREVV
ncbi:transcriptional regulator [Lysinibacillus xylanilyticus]|uniref:transcriptional regulator n=1 Tax=Lysinibacillus xylanilyticus TaxID=582475 RepID=UPI0036DA5F7C